MPDISKVRFGLKNVQVATATFDGNSYTYGTPFAFPGAVTLTMDPVGDITDFKADDISYYLTSFEDGFEGSLEIARMVDQFLTSILKYELDDNNAVSNTDAKPSQFAMGFEVDGDPTATRYWLYRCTARKAGVGSGTKESANENQNQTMDLRAARRETDGKAIIFMEADGTNDAVFNTFLDSVYEPVVTP